MGHAPFFPCSYEYILYPDGVTRDRESLPA
jgi:hypothetical protein